jgi:hypothetical protein
MSNNTDPVGTQGSTRHQRSDLDIALLGGDDFPTG